MMAEDDPHLLAALAIVDGTPVDWTGVSAASGALFAELRFIEALVRAHDSLNLPAQSRRTNMIRCCILQALTLPTPPTR